MDRETIKNPTRGSVNVSVIHFGHYPTLCDTAAPTSSTLAMASGRVAKQSEEGRVTEPPTALETWWLIRRSTCAKLHS